MKIRTNIDNASGRYHVTTETLSFSAHEEDLMSDHGEPIINVGGSISESVTRPGETAPIVQLSHGSAYDIRAVVEDGAITSYDVVSGGAGYASLPTVSIIGGGGEDATASARLGVATVLLASVGSGYAVNDTITLAGGTHTVAAVLTVKTIDALGMVTSVEITNPGVYSVIPAGVVGQASTSGAGTNVAFTISWTVVQVTPIAQGSGYYTVPTGVNFTLADKQRRIKSDFPDKRVVDLADTPLADLMAKAYADTIVARLTSAISDLRAKASPFEGETIVTV